MSRPVLSIQAEPFDQLLEVLALVGLVLLIGLPAFYFPELPDRIPTHFGPGGQPDAYGPKSTLFILPAVGIILYLGLSVLNRYPHLFNYTVKITEENAYFQYKTATRLLRALKLLVVLVFLFLVNSSIQIALGKQIGLGAWFLPGFLAGLFGTVGYFLYRGLKGKG